MTDFLPFDVMARIRARDRAANLINGKEQLLEYISEELTARDEFLGNSVEGEHLHIGLMLPPPSNVLPLDPSPILAARYGGMVGQEDQKHFADGRFAKITAFMTLHGVNDLPGALVLARRALKAGGRFTAVMPAGFSLGQIREAFLEADVASGQGVPARVGPTLDSSHAGGLLQRAGFLEPVADVETLTVRYQTLADFARDARAHGDTGWLAARFRGLTTPRRWAQAEANFQKWAEPDGRVPVDLQILYLSGKAG